jgi:hypothetical protein
LTDGGEPDLGNWPTPASASSEHFLRLPTNAIRSDHQKFRDCGKDR